MTTSHAYTIHVATLRRRRTGSSGRPPYQELDFDSWDQLGNAYWKTDREEEALDAWWRVIGLASERLEINPNDRNALNYIAEAYAKLGRPCSRSHRS